MELPVLGLISRTMEDLKLGCFSELMQHQLMVATSCGSKLEFLAGLFHDTFKCCMNWERKDHGWSWYHWDKDLGFELFLPIFQDLGLDSAEARLAAELCSRHHWDELNPIRKIEVGYHQPQLESSLRIDALGKLCEVLDFRLNHPYHGFVLSSILHLLRSKLSLIYSRIFSEFGVRSLETCYRFENYSERWIQPHVKLSNEILKIECPVRAPELDGYRCIHRYGEWELNLRISSNKSELSAGFGDLLCFSFTSFTAPTPGLGLACTSPGFMERSVFRELINRFLREVVEQLESQAPGYSSQEIIRWLRSEPEAKESCMFCGSSSKPVRFARSLARFTDVARVASMSRYACPICLIGYNLEGRELKLGLIPLPADSSRSDVLPEFGKDIIIPGFPMLSSISDHPWRQLSSMLFYSSIFSDGFSKIKSKSQILPELLRFFISRELVLYPIKIKLIPRAIISSWGFGTRKKFVLNTDSSSDDRILVGSQRDLTLKDLEMLETLKDLDPKLLLDAYGKLRKTYGF